MQDSISIVANYLINDRKSFINASCVNRIWRSVFMDRVYLLPLRVLDLILFLEKNTDIKYRHVYLANEVGYYLYYCNDMMTFSHERWENKPINVDHYTKYRSKLLPFLIQYIESHTLEPKVNVDIHMKCL